MKGFNFFCFIFNSYDTKTLWIVAVFSIIAIDIFIDLSIIFLIHFMKISNESTLWSYLILNGFTASVCRFAKC